MIACVSPGSQHTDHTVNTLRYAIRLKSDKRVKNMKYKPPVAKKHAP